MPTVITFWQTPDDERDFLVFLESLGKVLAFPNGWFETKKGVEPKPIAEIIKRHQADQLNFALEEYASEAKVEAHEFDGKRLFGVTAMRSCLIAYTRPKFRHAKTLGQSNICAYWDYLSEDQARIVPKRKDFVKWAKNVFAWVRKATPEQHELNGFSYRATKRAKHAFAGEQFIAAF